MKLLIEFPDALFHGVDVESILGEEDYFMQGYFSIFRKIVIEVLKCKQST